MNTLNLGSDDEPVVKKKSNTRNLKIALGLAAVILIPSIGSTLAGSISLNAGSAVEFGQGIAQATACDSNGITVTPASSFTNTEGAGSFALGTVTIAGIANTCNGKTFKIKAQGDTGDAITVAAGGATTDALIFTTAITGDPLTCVATKQASANYSTACSVSANANSVLVTLVTTTSDAIFKFTVETA